MPTMQRRIPERENLEQVIRGVNRWADTLLGNRGGRIRLRGDDGAAVDIRGGAPVSVGNYLLDASSAAGLHLNVPHSSGAPIMLRVTDSVVTVQTLGVTSNATVGGTLGVTGHTTLSTLGVTSNATVGGTLGVTGNTTLSGTLGVTGNAAFDGNVALGNAAGDAVTVPGTLAVTGATTITGILTAPGVVMQSGHTSSIGASYAGTSYTNCTSSGVTLTTGACELLVWGVLCGNMTLATNAAYMALRLDSGLEVAEVVTVPANSSQFSQLAAWRFTGVTAGSHTVHMRWKVSGSTYNGFSGSLLVLEVRR